MEESEVGRCRWDMNKVPFAILLLLSPFTFLANPFIGVPGIDSSIFIHVARGIINGLIPYRDVFDQKGPLLYFIDVIGLACGGVLGIWLLDIIVFYLVMWVFWQICITVFGVQSDVRKSLILVSGIISILYHGMACGGNMPEMWIAFFEGVAWYVLLRCVMKGEVLNIEGFLMGVCIGAVLMLKLNMIGIALPVAIHCLSSNTNNGRRSVFTIIAGVIVVVLPIILWFACCGGLGALWEVYVCYNAQYAKTMQSGKSLISIVTSRFFWPIVVVLAVNIWWMVICRRTELWNVARLNFVFLAVDFMLIIVSGGSPRYYGPVLPACVLPICFLLGRLKFNKVLSLNVMTACVLFTSALVFVRNYGNMEREKYDALRVLGESAGVVGSDSVMVLGCDCYAYKMLDAWCPSRFVFQGTIGKCSERYRTKIIEEIYSGKIRFIVAPKGTLHRSSNFGMSWAKNTVEHFYRRLSSNEDYDIWIRKS